MIWKAQGCLTVENWLAYFAQGLPIYMVAALLGKARESLAPKNMQLLAAFLHLNHANMTAI